MTNFPSIDPNILSRATGGASCLASAKSEAIKFSAQQNKQSPSSIKATSGRLFSKEHGVNYYAVGLNNREALNVGLKKNCSLSEIDYVGDGA